MSKYIFLVLSVFSAQAWAVGFHCYSMPTRPGYAPFPVQTVEFASGICTDGGSVSGDASTIGQDGERPTMCMVSAGCKVVDDEEAKKPAPPLDDATISAQWQSLEIKQATLLCKGTTTYKGGKAISALCPPIEQCRDDVLFHYFPANMGTPYVVPVNVPGTEEGKAKR